MYSIDLEKTFDRVQHNKMLQIVESIEEIDDKNIRRIANLYRYQLSNVRVRNQISDKIKIKRGIRQECILSPFFFNLYFEQICKIAFDGDHKQVGGCTK